MKILVGLGMLDGCAYYRLMLPYLALRAKGYDIEFIDRPDDPRVDSADIIVLQRQTSRPVLERIRAFQKRGGKVVFDFDDNIHQVPADNPASRIYGAGKPATKVMEHFIREADVVTVSTSYLKKQYDEKFRSDEAGRAIQLCYNVLEDTAFEKNAVKAVSGTPKRTGEIRIGWAGSDTHRGDFATIVEPLTRILTEHSNVRLVMVGANMTDLMPQNLRSRVSLLADTWERGRHALNSSDVDSRKVSTRRWYDQLRAASMDIALAPLAKNSFNAAKSYVKLLEYGMMGIPTVASEFGPYAQYGFQALHMGHAAVRLASTPDEWAEHLTALVESSLARATLATANLEEVRRGHTMLTNVCQWEDALAPLMAREVVAA